MFIPASPKTCYHIPSPDGKEQKWTPTGFSLSSTLDLRKLEKPVYAGYPPRAIALWQYPGCKSEYGLPIVVIKLWNETGTQTLKSFWPSIWYADREHFKLGISEVGARSFEELEEGSWLWERIGQDLRYGDVYEVLTVFGEEVTGELYPGLLKEPVGSDDLETVPVILPAVQRMEAIGSPRDLSRDYSNSGLGFSYETGPSRNFLDSQNSYSGHSGTENTASFLEASGSDVYFGSDINSNNIT
ncbi:hypothetical protein TWF730_005873 [Orbilia blumenaviensis]|uniref:Uncharacterized protein n=1 Tax=Orbilia blumenaviensis TaxID=1796055 RepID=A0AAV9VMV8_9PEZI